MLRVSHFSFRPHSRLAFPVRPHSCFAFPISHSALIRASRFPFVLIRASRFPFLIPPSFAPRVSRSSSFVLRVSHFSFRPHSRPEYLASPSALMNFSPPRPPSFVSALIRAPNFLRLQLDEGACPELAGDNMADKAQPQTRASTTFQFSARFVVLLAGYYLLVKLYHLRVYSAFSDLSEEEILCWFSTGEVKEYVQCIMSGKVNGCISLRMSHVSYL